MNVMFKIKNYLVFNMESSNSSIAPNFTPTTFASSGFSSTSLYLSLFLLLAYLNTRTRTVFTAFLLRFAP